MFLGVFLLSVFIGLLLMNKEGMLVLNYDGYDPNKKIEGFRGWGGRGWGGRGWGRGWGGYRRNWNGRWGRRGFYYPCVNCYECVGAECDSCEYC